MSISHFKLSQALVMSALTTVVGAVVTVVPAWAPEKEAIIAGLAGVLAAVVPLTNAIHTVVAARVSSKDLEGDLKDFAKAEVQRVDVNGLVHDAIAGENVEALVHSELNRILLATGLKAKLAEVPEASDAPEQPVVAPVEETVSTPAPVSS